MDSNSINVNFIAMVKFIRKVEWYIGRKLFSLLPQTVLQSFCHNLCEHNPQIVLEALGPYLQRKANMDNMPFDLPVKGNLQFEHLAGLFASTSLDHAVISMTIRQSAYLFGLIRQMKARKVIEIGRYKGGSTLLIAAAMNGEGEFWSIDNREKEIRLHSDGIQRPFDEMLADICKKFGLKVNIIVGDSQTVQIDTGEVDLVFIDGLHTYEGVKSDFERFGKRVSVGGAVLLDDAFDERFFNANSGVAQLVEEVLYEGEFKLFKVVNRMVHLERVKP